MTPDECSGEEIDDIDDDGLSDWCEDLIAQHFEPTLRYTSFDDISGEPAYAVRPLGFTGGRYYVLVAYLLSEYLDQGTGHCHEWDLPDHVTCGHFGDSEAIILRVRYEASIHHWVVDAAWYSQHDNYGRYCVGSTNEISASTAYLYAGTDCSYGSGDDLPEALGYAGNDGGNPIAHVSISKHANYASEGECQGGNPIHFLGIVAWADDCESNTSLGVDVIGYTRNVGSSDLHQLDCTMSYAIYDDSYEECYWTGSTFGGWSGASPQSDPYVNRLLGFGY